MNIMPAKDFNLKATLESGQVFRYHHDGNTGFYCVVAGGSIIKIRQIGSRIEYDCSSKVFDVAKLFGFNHSYGKIIKSISRDEKIRGAINKHYGLRILEQQPWECTASFICSAFSNIPRIRQCIEKVSAAFGSRIEFDGFKTFSFPQPQQISDFAKLKKCGLGYRAKYLFETARIFSNNSEDYSLQQLRKLSYAAAKERLMELPGVGSKVADCILLFAYGFYGAFPVDVWIHRAMADSYGAQLRKLAAAGKKTGKGKISESVVAGFARGYFGEYAGYAQQFLYHHSRIEKAAKIAKTLQVPGAAVAAVP
ncbi:hypothetical protein HYU16_03855 [Candidatus Woesearchaeota archaeon]|nr:hypothetical protein [Candidatus Woesearchaeota archaeon]